MADVLVNNANNKKRRRRTFETAANKRSRALDSNAAMVLINIQDQIDEALVAFSTSFFSLIMTAYAWIFEMFDDGLSHCLLSSFISIIKEVSTLHSLIKVIIVDISVFLSD
jgi:hypothetical protein